MKKILNVISGLIFLNITGYCQKYEPYISENKQWRYHKAYILTSGGKIDFVETGFFRGSDDIKDNKYKDFLNWYVFPNPVISSSILKVESNLHEEFEIEIYDYLGRLIREDYFYNDYPIGSISLRKGIYIYRIFNKKRIVGLNKIIVL